MYFLKLNFDIRIFNDQNDEQENKKAATLSQLSAQTFLDIIQQEAIPYINELEKTY